MPRSPQTLHRPAFMQPHMSFYMMKEYFHHCNGPGCCNFFTGVDNALYCCLGCKQRGAQIKQNLRKQRKKIK